MINICVPTWLNCPLFVCPYNPKWSIDDALDKYIMGMLCLLFFSKHVSVSLLFVNKQSVSWSFVCQFIIDMLFAPSHNDTEQFVLFHHYYTTSGSPPWVFPRGPPRQHRVAWESPKWADNLAGHAVKRTVCSTPRQRVVVRAHETSRGWGDFVKSVMCGLYYTGVFCDIWTLLFFLVLFLFFRLMYICHNIIYLCLLMATSMFSADFANKTFKLDLSLFTYVGHTN